MAVCFFECSLTTFVIEAQVPAAYDVISRAVGSYGFGKLGKLGAKALLRILLPLLIRA